MENYPEIKQLVYYFKLHPLKMKRIQNKNNEGFVFVEVAIADKKWNVFVDDEYDNFNDENPLLNFYLLLASLEDYQESTDYLDWCKQNMLKTNDFKWLDYYQSLKLIYAEISSYLGTIDSCITPLDYQLSTGVIDVLKNYKL